MKKKLILLSIALLIIFVLAEIAFTILVDKDLDGNLSLNNIHLKPYHLPIFETRKKIDELIKHKVPDSLLQQYNGKNFKREYFDVRLIPDSILGWKPNLIYKSKDGLYIYNKDRIRSKDILADYSQKKGLRIAIFGDSYFHGDEVKYENTIGNYLETMLRENNVDAEVLNFALSGYGMDQAFLKWKSISAKFKPDIVIIGVQFENVKRHINLLRPFYYYITNIPYSKPRFILQGNKLQFISNPILDITQTTDIIKHFKDWKFFNFEEFYSEENYHPSFLYYSKSISFICSAFSQIFDEINFYKPQSESFQVTYKIFEMFKNSVEHNGEIFIPVHLPVKNDFDFIRTKFLNIIYNQQFIYDELFQTLKHKAKFVESYNALKKWNSANENDGLFLKRHYSPIANKIIANQIYSFLQSEHPQMLKPKERQN